MGRGKEISASARARLGFDTETTGLSVSSERAVSYAFARTASGFRVVRTVFRHTDRPISPSEKGARTFSRGHRSEAGE